VKKASLVVLISGGGSNLQAIIQAIGKQYIHAEIKAVISNKASVRGLDYAASANITTHVIEHTQYPSREAFDQAMMQVIDPLKPDLVILAGFMRILSTHFIEHYENRLINIHPSLLPKYKGLNTHQQVLENNDVQHGASVHYVKTERDSGPIVIQVVVPGLADDDKETLALRVLKAEHKIYSAAIKMHCENKITFEKNKIQYDGKVLSKPLLWENNTLIQQ
jgi:phosphoribosylglycinamide formyltransferase-1